MNSERKVLTEPEAVKAFEYLFPSINGIIKDSFDTVKEWQEFQKKKGFRMSLPSVNAMLMYGCIVNNATQKFKRNPEFPEIEAILYPISRMFGLKFRDSAFIRFKKVDDNFLPSRGNTEQARELNSQLKTEYFPSDPCIITIGYRVDKAWSELQNINMLCLKGRENLWNFPIDRAAIPTAELEFSEFEENVSYSVEQLIKTKKKA
jgi:hypothetical protein